MLVVGTIWELYLLLSSPDDNTASQAVNISPHFVYGNDGKSVEYALKMQKPIYVLPHRINESEGTNKLLQDGKATAIYSIDDFIKEAYLKK